MRATTRACFSVLAAAVVGGLGACAPATHKPIGPSEFPAGRSRAAISQTPVLRPPASMGRNRPEVEPAFETSHPSVQDFLAAYQTRQRGFIERSLERGRQYLPTMRSILEQEGVPLDLVYLPIIESGFRLNAVSPAGAVGPWQFIHSTGRRYGLRIDRYVDERRDPEKATRAAARYLRDLYSMFEDWHLSLAAYNTGEANVARIRDRAQIDDYWEMIDRGYLPRETRQYVPKFLAALEIAKSPEEYGIYVAKGSRPSRYDRVNIDKSISLKTVAELTGASVAEITELNPALRAGVVPPQGYEVRLPKGTRQAFEQAYANLKVRRATAVVWDDAPLTHRVRRGETLSGIARRYRVSVQALMRENGLRKARSLQAGKTIRIPGQRKPARDRRYASSLDQPGSRTLN
jgi:membrane-bound lytic murein transglycosylase D